MIRMIDIRAATLLTFLIGLVYAGLALHAYQGSNIELASRPVNPWAPSLQNAASPNPQPSPTDMTEALEHPLFRLPREPFVAIVEVAPAPQPAVAPEIAVQPMPPAAQPAPPRQFQLTGISVVGGKPSALLTTTEEPQGKWVAVDDLLQEWKVTKISTTSVTLKAKTAEIILELYVDKANETVGTIPAPQ